MLNAGILMTPEALTEDGYELQFGTNHMGHALFEKLLMPVLMKTVEKEPKADVRVVVLTSAAAGRSGEIHFEKLKSTCAEIATFKRYSQSKLSNALYARELAKRYPQLRVAAVHPGAVFTNLPNYLRDHYILPRIFYPLAYVLLQSLDAGVGNQLRASVSKDLVSGEYYVTVGNFRLGRRLASRRCACEAAVGVDSGGAGVA